MSDLKILVDSVLLSHVSAGLTAISCVCVCIILRSIVLTVKALRKKG